MPLRNPKNRREKDSLSLKRVYSVAVAAHTSRKLKAVCYVI